jgi:CRP/FNR family transcriptional regulator, anaerobic regulatory protein
MYADRASLSHGASRSPAGNSQSPLNGVLGAGLLGITSAHDGVSPSREAPRGVKKRPDIKPDHQLSDFQRIDDGVGTPHDTQSLRLIPSLRGVDRKVEAGGELFGVGAPCDAVHNLISGWVALYTLLEDGRRQIVQFALPGAVFGAFRGKGARTSFGAHALTDAIACAIPHDVLLPHLRDDPEIALRLVRSLGRDCSMAFDHLTSIGRRSARERVANLLLELFVRCRAQWPGDRIEEMYLPLTQEHIGDATGLTFVHVNRVLRILRKEGIVEFHHRRLRILDPDRLIDVAGVDHQAAMAWL